MAVDDGTRVLVCILGSFRVLRDGEPVPLRAGGKGEQVLAALAINAPSGLERESLMELVWPTSESLLAGQSLNTLVYTLAKILRDALCGQPPVLRDAGRYRLNFESGVAVDVGRFEEAATAADRAARVGDRQAAIYSYRKAVAMYAGDLVIGASIRHMIERERLRARYLSALARVADHELATADYESALHSALTLLEHDPCREDAHRVVMRCYVRLGERAQALRHYQVCRTVLRVEFDAVPEPMTESLYEAIRLNPNRV